jgi:competence protein ComEA
MTSSDDQARGPYPDDDWTLNERLLVLWDRAAVRWLVALFVGALIVAVFALMRSTPSESVSSASVTTPGSAPPSASGQPTAGGGGPGGVTATATPPMVDVIVDVVGPVREPGVVTLPAGSRVADAVAAAGGLTKGKTAINLARVLVDGEQIDVAAPAGGAGPGPAVGGGTGTGTGAGTSANKGTTSLINLNTATESELQELPRVGPVTAGKIIDFRTQYGGFRSVDQLKEVSGVGEVTFSGIAPLVTV